MYNNNAPRLGPRLHAHARLRRCPPKAVDDGLRCVGGGEHPPGFWCVLGGIAFTNGQQLRRTVPVIALKWDSDMCVSILSCPALQISDSASPVRLRLKRDAHGGKPPVYVFMNVCATYANNHRSRWPVVDRRTKWLLSTASPDNDSIHTSTNPTRQEIRTTHS